jgi:endonuclease/exonuclease/phosphatase family metal-dependent hydrolase
MNKLNEINILSFNILAETWFSNHLYNKEIIPYLNKYFPIKKRNKSSIRINILKSYLDNLINSKSYDIICLQETDNYFNNYLVQKYSDTYQIFSVYHDDKFWLSWINPNIPFYPNGQTTMIKKTTFSKIDFIDIKLDIGNHCIFTKCIDLYGNTFNIINAHLDTEDETNLYEYLNYIRLGRGRYIELKNIIQTIDDNPADINLVIGDLNDGLDGFATKVFLTNNDFTDLFKITNNLLNTYPYKIDDSIPDKVEPHHLLDKIFIKSTTKITCENTTIFNKYDTIIENILNTGSDHYAIDASIIQQKSYSCQLVY